MVPLLMIARYANYNSLLRVILVIINVLLVHLQIITLMFAKIVHLIAYFVLEYYKINAFNAIPTVFYFQENVYRLVQ
jgi:hypothetical protein